MSKPLLQRLHWRVEESKTPLPERLRPHLLQRRAPPHEEYHRWHSTLLQVQEQRMHSKLQNKRHWKTWKQVSVLPSLLSLLRMRLSTSCCSFEATQDTMSTLEMDLSKELWVWNPWSRWARTAWLRHLHQKDGVDFLRKREEIQRREIGRKWGALRAH